MSEKVALYARVSHRKQAEKQLSVPFQLRDLRKWCKSLRWDVVGEYKDEGISGKTIQRPAFLRMIADAEAGMFNRIVIHAVDRFGRSKADAALKESLRQSHGIRFAYYMEHLTGDECNDIIVDVHEMMARDYVKKAHERSEEGKREAVLLGGSPGGAPPFGYRHEVIPWTRTRSLKTLVPDEKFAPVVTELFKRYASGEKLVNIVTWLSSLNIPTPGQLAGRPCKSWRCGIWTHAHLSPIMRNPVYVGDLVYGRTLTYRSPNGTMLHKDQDSDKWLVIRNHHKPLIDRETFELAKRRRLSQTKVPSRAYAMAVLAGGIGRCAGCGGPINVVNKSKDVSKWRFYCSYNASVSRDGACRGSVTLQCVARQLSTYLQHMLKEPAQIESAIREYNARISKTPSPLKRAYSELHRVRTLERALRDSVDGPQLPAEFTERLRNATNKRAQMESTVALLEKSIKHTKPISALRFITAAKQIYAAMPNLGMLPNELISEVFSHVFVSFRRPSRDRTTERTLARLCRTLISPDTSGNEKRAVAEELAAIYLLGPMIVAVPRFMEDKMCDVRLVNETVLCFPIKDLGVSQYIRNFPDFLDGLNEAPQSRRYSMP